MAEWLCSGLQSRVRRFDSDSGLQKNPATAVVGHNAGIAQLVEHDLAKVGVASSSLVSRSSFEAPVCAGASLFAALRGGLLPGGRALREFFTTIYYINVISSSIINASFFHS